ncbi:hypothetical protein [Amphritea balenae]|uniref:Uncharacterized protein n=1 Tax=Amphritea balenae TaxID=452629 RepID=A0A3P1SXA1_9GAMM|nr:hypothetical protein [Amphritea balenae]RRD01166.1 hypothetical protein EHS89_00970 [Amphritea balenae]GGK59401.1 hypothetical protein GCM10007941_07030 [Amphritea balenae]
MSMSDLYTYNDTQMNLSRVRNGVLVFTGTTDDGTELRLEVAEEKKVKQLDIEMKDAWSFVDLIPDASSIFVGAVSWQQLQ